MMSKRQEPTKRFGMEAGMMVFALLQGAIFPDLKLQGKHGGKKYCL